MTRQSVTSPTAIPLTAVHTALAAPAKPADAGAMHKPAPEGAKHAVAPPGGRSRPRGLLGWNAAKSPAEELAMHEKLQQKLQDPTREELEKCVALMEKHTSALQRQLKSFLKGVEQLAPAYRNASGAPVPVAQDEPSAIKAPAGGLACLGSMCGKRPKLSEHEKAQQLKAQAAGLLSGREVTDMTLAAAAVIVARGQADLGRAKERLANARLRLALGVDAETKDMANLRRAYESAQAVLHSLANGPSARTATNDRTSRHDVLTWPDFDELATQLLVQATSMHLDDDAMNAWENFIGLMAGVRVDENVVRNEETAEGRWPAAASVAGSAVPAGAAANVANFDHLEIQEYDQGQNNLAFAHPGNSVVRNDGGGDCLFHALEGRVAQSLARSGAGPMAANLDAGEVRSLRRSLAELREGIPDTRQNMTRNAHQVAMALFGLPWVTRRQAALLMRGRVEIPNAVYAALQKVPGVRAGEDELTQWCQLKTADSRHPRRVLVVDMQGALYQFDAKGGHRIPMNSDDKETVRERVLEAARESGQIALFRSGNHWERYQE
jgi:hypothetical protein